jgi:ankyrin repeat protein
MYILMSGKFLFTEVLRFQYIQCQFEILQRLSSESEIYEALQKLPKGLDATYDRIFENIDPDFQERVIHSVKWLAFSMKTLTLEELSEIFIIRPNRDIAINNSDRLFSPEYVLEYFSGLIVTQENREQYYTITEVRLVHFSLKEYFISTRIVESAPAFAFTEVEAHISIASACLAYLKQFSHEIAKYSHYELSGLKKYIPDYWMIHLEEIPREWWPAEWAQNVAIVLGFHSQSFLNQLKMERKLRSEENEVDSYIQLPSYCFTARLGLYRFTQMLLSQEPNAYTTQEDLDVALQHAAYGGNKEVMKLFLERGADVNAECGKWGSALLASVATGNLSAIELLVEFGASVNSPSERGRRLLARLNEQSTQCLKFLLDSGADIDMQGSDDGTALTYTLKSRDINHGRFELLLERNASVNALGGVFYTPLQTACANIKLHEYQHYVESLLERGANPNIRGGVYDTALQAVCCRYDRKSENERASSVAQLLIDHGADVNLRGGKYGSAFNAAASLKPSQAIQIMKLLLDNGVDVDQQEDPEHGTALHIACCKGAEETVRWLLDKGLDVNAESGRFATPLQAAAAGDKRQTMLDIVKLLIIKGARVNQQGGEYGTALQAAYSNSNIDEEVCRLLLDQGANISVNGGKYGTVLAAACGNNQVSVESVRLLLDRGADVNADGGEYGTALIAACARWSSNIELVRLLLDHGADINAGGGKDGTALATACKRGESLDLVKLLLERGADPRHQNCLAWHMAARSDGGDIVPILKLLLDYVDINHVHEEHGTALKAIIELWNLGWRSIFVHRWQEKARFLLESCANAELMTGKFGSALQAACAAKYIHNHEFGDGYNGDIDYACSKTKLLLEHRPDINVDAQGGIYNTALQAAAYSGQMTSIKLLLDKNADCNIRGGKYGSALNAAIISGFWDVVEILLKAGATPDSDLQEEPDEEWLQRVREEGGRGAYERYMKFWEVQKASGGMLK